VGECQARLPGRDVQLRGLAPRTSTGTMLFERKPERAKRSDRLRRISKRHHTYKRMRPISLLAFLGWIAFSFSPIRARSQTQGGAPSQSGRPPVLVVGFVGGFVHVNDLRHSEVQLARQLQATYSEGVEVRIFENRQKVKAHHWVLEQLAETHVTKPAGDRNSRACIILFGHSWGASAVISLAQQLERDRVPVALTIQVDSIAKNGTNDSVVPTNVAEAINFYQTHGILHGRTTITAADPSRTRILGNLLFNYTKAPPECRAYPWYDRLFFAGHTSIECDPRVWSQVDALIRTRVLEGPQPDKSVVTAQVRH
jgi:hypothetical protein